MELEFPYQIVTFLDNEPKLNEPVYNGSHGWYPQLAIKRRFKIDGLDEEEFFEKLKGFFSKINRPNIFAGELVKPARMPVRAIHIDNQTELKKLHASLLNDLTKQIVSKYPDREGKDYYPHITAEYNGKFVIPVDEFVNKSFDINNVWLLKDVDDKDSLAYRKIC